MVSVKVRNRKVWGIPLFLVIIFIGIEIIARMAKYKKEHIP